MSRVQKRNLAIDRFRGLTIIVMVIVNDLANVEGIPAMLKHAPKEAGLTAADLVSKAFIFAIAATFALSFNKRAERGGKGDAYFHFFSRYLAIMGLGALFGTFETVINGATVWGTLQTIGLAGLLTLLAIKLPAAARAVIAVLILAGWQFVYQSYNQIFTGEVGAMLEALTMAAALILSTAMIDMYNKGLKPFLISTGILSLAAFGPLLLSSVKVTKNNQLTFILMCVAMCCVLYLAANLLSKVLPDKAGLTVWWGENPMLLYILHLILTGIAMALDPRSLWVAIPIDLLILTILSLIAWALHRKNYQFKF